VISGYGEDVIRGKQVNEFLIIAEKASMDMGPGGICLIIDFP